MGAYILRRLLLIIPTLIGVMLVNFILIQFVPGGPIEQLAARAQGEGDALEGIAGGSDAGQENAQIEENTRDPGLRGLPPEFIVQYEVTLGFKRMVCDDADLSAEELETLSVKRQLDAGCVAVPVSKTRQFLTMMASYATFDFGKSLLHSSTVVELVIDKMPVSITLGLWSTLLAYLISIPLGIRKAVRDGSRFDTWTSGAIIVAYAIPGFLFAIMLLVLFAGGSYWQIFPSRGLVSNEWDTFSTWGKITDYFWHIALPVIASTIGAFATLTLLTKNSFMDEIKKQYVITAKAKGLTEARVLYGHVFRNAMLIVIAGFPAAFLGVFFGASLLIETVFSLDGLGRLGFEAAVDRNYPVFFGTLYVFGLIGLLTGLITDLMYVFVDPRIDFESRRT